MKFSNFTTFSKVGMIIAAICAISEVLLVISIGIGIIKGVGELTFIIPIIGGIACALVFVILICELIRYEKQVSRNK